MDENAKIYEIHGTVTGHDGKPLQRARVVVWHQSIRERKELAAEETSERGSYEIRYKVPENLSRPLLLIVEAVSEYLDAPLYSPLTEAQPTLEVNLNFQQPDQSEWATLVRSIEPMLEGLKLSDLVENSTHQDISFLAREVGNTTEAVMRIAVSARLATAFKLPATAFYAFLRQQIPSALPSPLLDASQNFTLIVSLVQRIGSLIFALSADVQQRTLTAAVALDLIGPQYTAQIPELVKQLQALRATDLLNQPYLVGNTTLSQILDVAALPPAKQQVFSQALAANAQPMRNFWRTLGDGQHGFTAAEASSIERTVSIGAFVKNFTPLMQTLMQGFTTGTYKTTADLARLSRQDWIQLVNQTGPPPGIDAAGTATPAEVFASVVYIRVTRAYPTVALSSRIAGGKLVPQDQQQPLALFFQNNSGLELIKDNIPIYLAAQGTKAFTGIDQKDQAAVVANARTFQRVLRVAPNTDVSETLLNLGINSATQIATLGEQQFFLKATAAGLTKTEANHVYQAAAQRYASVVSLYMQMNSDAIGVWPKMMGQLSDLQQPVQQAIQRDQSLATLFGSQDYCATDDCTSVLSPAAYLCDLLLWLRNHPQGAQTALDVLDSRRPDIRHLLLNCPNTDTELPYIDLVNELLADKISPPTDPNSTINPPWKQTSVDLTATQLSAAPEYFNQAAYVTLFNATYPQSLPYSAGLDELRTYLLQWNLPLWQLRQALLPLNGGSAVQQAAVSAERLGMNLPAEDLVITSNLASVFLATVWNTSDFSATPPTGLASVPGFLQGASLLYESLLELLQVSWVQGGLNITLQGSNDLCDTSSEVLSPAPLDPGFLDRAHRFLRLWHSSDYKMWELDLLLNAPNVGNGALDQNTLIAIQAFWQLQNATRLGVDQQLAFYQNIDTATHRDPDGTTTTSFYAQIFLNPVVAAVAPDPDLAALPTGGVISDPNLGDHLPAIQAALGISAADAATLFALTDGTLTLSNLSLLYRISTLAIASKFSISGLLSVAGLLDPTAATPAAAVALLFASPAATLAFLTQAKNVQQSGVPPDALTYLLTAPSASILGGWATTTQMTQADIATALGTVQQAALNPNGDVNGSVIAAVAANAHTVSAAGIANDVSALTLNTLNVPGTGKTLLAILTDPAFTASTSPITSINFPNQFLAIQLFDKVAVLVRGLHLVLTDLTWLLAQATVYGGLDFTQLPVTTAQPGLALSPLLTMLLVIKLARLFTAAPPASSVQTLYDIIGGVHLGTLVNEAETQAALATITGWPLADIVAFTAALGFAFPANYTQPSAYDAIRTLEAMATAASATGPQIVEWAAVPTDEPGAENQAASALAVLKAQHPNNDDWLALSPTLMNPLREDRSAALQAYLIGQRDGTGNLIYGDTDGLFNTFLIDVQMSSCQVTSRVVQAYIAVQIFVERCLMNLEAPAVVVDLSKDDTWNQWEWMKRYRIWEANREVFLYPENWLIESQRPNRTEIYQKFEQEVRQGQSTTDYLETVVLNYIDRLDGLAHLTVTGTCEDPVSGAIYVVARSIADPPVFYLRSYVNGAWSGWTQIPLDIKAHQVVPALYRNRICLFWMDVKVSNEPRQPLPSAQQSSTPPNQNTDQYVTLGVYFSIFRNGTWAPAQTSKGKLFDKPFYDTTSSAGDPKTVEALYTLKVQTQAPAPGYGATLFLDVFRLGNFQTWSFSWLGNLPVDLIMGVDDSVAVHLGRAVFDGRFNDLELRNFEVPGAFVSTGYDMSVALLSHAQSTYGPDALPLLPLPDNQADPNLTGEPGLIPQAGALTTAPANVILNPIQTIQLTFTSTGALDQNVGPLLNTAAIPFRVVGPNTDLTFDPTSYFFFQDNRRSYYVESPKYYWTGSFFSPVTPSNPASVPFEVRYRFHSFYHPFTRLFWHQLSAGGFDLLYDPNLQANPDQIDPSGADVFSFNTTYQPFWRVTWDHDDVTGQDRQFLDFSPSGTFSVYNWELFYHVPLYVAQLLSQNQQFEDAQTWFQYIFNPSRQSSDPVPQRFWIPKPLHNLTSVQILQQQINNLLEAVNQGNPTAVAEVQSWRNDPFNPFLLADQRPVAYMKSTVMSYLDNLIAWADNLFSSESREALSEATLIYVIASEILGPLPAAVTPPQHADESFDQLEPILDAFANAMVDIENVIGGSGGGAGGGTGGIPGPQTFYFKIPPNDQLLGYWTTVADRLFKLRHCQTIGGAPLQLALFDAPINPGLLIAAQAAGVDLSSVLNDLTAPLPNYRFTSLYSQALDFVNAVRAYGSSLQAALEKNDGGALLLLQQTTQQQLLSDGNQVLDWQIQKAQSDIDATQQSFNLAQQKYNFNSTQSWPNVGEAIQGGIEAAMILTYGIAAVGEALAAGIHSLPDFTVGAAGFGASPTAVAKVGGSNFGNAASSGAAVGKAVAAALDRGAALAGQAAAFERRQDNWDEAAIEAKTQMDQATAQLTGLGFMLQIAQQNQTLHQEQIDNIQKQIDFLTNKFTSDSLYDWMVGSLSDTYFQSYQLAYQMCKQVERCYQFELGIQDSSFIQFGYWDSLHKGLLAGETLNHDLRRMQSSYLQQNARRYELSRFVSLGILNVAALQQLLVMGSCDFTLPESLFDNDYPGHYNRRLTRVSVTVVYPNPGKFDNIKATLTMVANQVRISTDTGPGYAENPVGSDTRFTYNYAAVPQKIATGNAQDDPGLFITSISSNIVDQRYLPFENAGAISAWHLDMPQLNNEVDLSTVGDVVLHLYYTALDGGAGFQKAVQDYNTANLPTSGIKVFSAQNDFSAPPASVANPYPVSPWQAFLTAGATQKLTLVISPSKFPAWTRGKTISVTSLTALAIAWSPGNFVLVPQAPLPSTPVTMTPVAGVTEPNVCSATIAMPANTPIGTWSFELQQQGAPDFQSLTKNMIGDVLLLLSYTVS